MSKKSFQIFSGTRNLESQIDEFLDMLSESNIIFRSGLTYFLEAGGSSGEAFQQKLAQVATMESRADELRRAIERSLYEQALIPESRGDVLGLLEDLDTLINDFEGNLIAFKIENPVFIKEDHKDIKMLAEQVALCVESIVVASRAFFRDIGSVRDNLHKTSLYEKEADTIANGLKESIFNSDITLDRKVHLRDFVNRVDKLANKAEDIADLLAIYTIKRAA